MKGGAGEWVVCPHGRGYRHEGGGVSARLRHFKQHAVGIRMGRQGGKTVVWLVGTDETWSVDAGEVLAVDVLQTGDKFAKKICNICHCLLPTERFARNQTKCPICQRRSIAGVTAKVVADHDHHTGNIRDFICDSCNTGLGRFKNGKDCLKDALAYIEEREGK